MPLTDVRIRSLKPADKPHKYSDGGLFLFIPPSDSKLWRMAYRFEGKSRLLSFGAYPAVSLKDARERRDEARRLLAKGIDPSAYKRQQQEARRIAERDSFQNIAREWHAHAWRHSLQSIRERSCTVSATTFSRLSAQRPSPGWKCRISWPCSGRWK